MTLQPTSLTDLSERLGRTQRTWLVTGAAGFIGSHLLETLLRLDQPVVGLDNFSTGSRRNLDEVREAVGAAAWARFTFLEGDITDPATCHRACEGVNVVLHQAALGSVPRSLEDPLATNRANVDGQLNMLVAARAAGVGRVVYAASSSTYGDSEQLPKREDVIGQPLSPYAVTKYVNELYAQVFGRSYGLQSIGLRYFNVFGPRQDPEGPYAAVIPRWTSNLAAGRRCTVFGDGSTSRDFCYVDNVVQANLRAAVTTDPAAIGQVYNVALGQRTTLNELYVAIRDRVAAAKPEVASLEPEYRPFRAGDVRHSQADIGKATRLLGYQPTHDVHAGLDAAMAWYLEQTAA